MTNFILVFLNVLKNDIGPFTLLCLNCHRVWPGAKLEYETVTVYNGANTQRANSEPARFKLSLEAYLCFSLIFLE